MFQFLWIMSLCLYNIRTCCFNDQCRSIPINAGSNLMYWSQCRSININIDQWQSISIKTSQCIEKYWSILIVIDRHWYLLSCILDQFLKFDLSLIGIDRHWSLIQHVLKQWKGSISLCQPDWKKNSDKYTGYEMILESSSFGRLCK